MRKSSILAFLIPALVAAAPAYAQDAPEADDTYLLHRADALKDRVELAVRERKITRKKAAKLQVAIGRVQTYVGNQQARNGGIDAGDADEMNQKLTDVERELPIQR